MPVRALSYQCLGDSPYISHNAMLTGRALPALVIYTIVFEVSANTAFASVSVPVPTGVGLHSGPQHSDASISWRAGTCELSKLPDTGNPVSLNNSPNGSYGGKGILRSPLFPFLDYPVSWMSVLSVVMQC